ncbi:MAG TPA: sensor histidine kinase [Dissulfurispiraceae bacterium]|nr:sensor histidine kinase [Dissulfurispiraceae bacterium]
MKIIEYFNNKSRGYLIAVGILLFIITGLADYLTGTEMSLSVFYLVPVGFWGWFVGRTAGILMSIFSTAAISLDYYLSEQGPGASVNFPVEAWNLSLVLGFFIVVTLLLSKLKYNISQREGLIELRTAELARTNQSLQLQIAGRIQAENELRKTYDDLERKVFERTEELSATNTLLMQEIDKHWEAKELILVYQKELQGLIHRLSILEEQDRRLLSEELHDTIGQNLALAKFKLTALRQSAASARTKKESSEVLELIEQSIKFTRSLTFELSSPIFYKLGLRSAIEWLCGHFQEKYGITVDFIADERLSRLDSETGILIFKSIRELLVNIIKHAYAKKAKITVTSDDHNIIIEVQDDGTGCNVSSLSLDKCKTGGFGLFNIRERINYLGGTFEISSKPNSGTWVSLNVPIKGDNPS